MQGATYCTSSKLVNLTSTIGVIYHTRTCVDYRGRPLQHSSKKEDLIVVLMKVACCQHHTSMRLLQEYKEMFILNTSPYRSAQDG